MFFSIIIHWSVMFKSNLNKIGVLVMSLIELINNLCILIIVLLF